MLSLPKFHEYNLYLLNYQREKLIGHVNGSNTVINVHSPEFSEKNKNKKFLNKNEEF